MLLLRRHIMGLAPQWSVGEEERCDMDRSHSSILKRQVGERAVRGWVIRPAGWDGVGKAFFKHLTGAECGVPCLRVIAARPPLCTGVITLHFTLPVILACRDSVFEQHGGSWFDWLNTMFLCMTEYRESQRVRSPCTWVYVHFIFWSQWALSPCWRKAGWFLPVVSTTRHLKILACTFGWDGKARDALALADNF